MLGAGSGRPSPSGRQLRLSPKPWKAQRVCKVPYNPSVSRQACSPAPCAAQVRTALQAGVPACSLASMATHPLADMDSVARQPCMCLWSPGNISSGNSYEEPTGLPHADEGSTTLPHSPCTPAEIATVQTLGFIDMGTMLCQGSPGAVAGLRGLTQLLVPGLEQRAWQLPPLKALPVSPGTRPQPL